PLAQICGLTVTNDVANLVHSRSPPSHFLSFRIVWKDEHSNWQMEGLVGVGIPLESPKVALFQRKGGFLLSERWLAQNGTVAFFGRTTHPRRAYGSRRDFSHVPPPARGNA